MQASSHTPDKEPPWMGFPEGPTEGILGTGMLISSFITHIMTTRRVILGSSTVFTFTTAMLPLQILHYLLFQRHPSIALPYRLAKPFINELPRRSTRINHNQSFVPTKKPARADSWHHCHYLQHIARQLTSRWSYSPSTLTLTT